MRLPSNLEPLVKFVCPECWKQYETIRGYIDHVDAVHAESEDGGTTGSTR